MYIIKEFQEVTTPQSSKIGDIDHDLSGEDGQYSLNTIDDIVTFLRLNDVAPSASNFNPDIWYTTQDEDESTNGNKTTYSFFLDDKMTEKKNMRYL